MKKNPKSSKKTLISLIPLFAALLSSAVTFLVASNVWSTLVAHPDFEILPSLDLSSINMTNIGQAAAHQVKVTLAMQGNHTDFLWFSNENATWQRSYDSTKNQTIIAANMQRLAVNAKVVVRFV